MIITRDQVKQFLGINDNTYDTQIDLYIPIIDGKVKQITNNNWNDLYYCNIDTTKYIEVSEFDGENIEAGQQVTGSNITANSYIVNIYNNTAEINNTTYTAPFVELNQVTEGTETGANLFFGFPYHLLPLVSKGVWWLIQGENTNAVKGSVQSKSIGKVSVSFSDMDNKLDGVSGMPTWFVKGLPRYHGGL